VFAGSRFAVRLELSSNLAKFVATSKAGHLHPFASNDSERSREPRLATSFLPLPSAFFSE
jgi:hypothetical protein